MTIPLLLPDWVPWWVNLGMLLAALFFALLLLLMPFSVFGTKSRLETIELRLDEIQAEIRSLALRLPEDGGVDDDEYSRGRDRSRRPPIPPAPMQARRDPSRAPRTEPRLY